MMTFAELDLSRYEPGVHQGTNDPSLDAPTVHFVTASRERFHARKLFFENLRKHR